jgi:hypothetical protein
MHSALQSQFLWLIVSSIETCPGKPADPKPSTMSVADWKAEKKEYLDWLLRDQAAQGLMKGATESSQWPHVSKADTSKQMWDSWQAMYIINQQPIDFHYHFKELYTRKYMESTSMADHIAAMLDLGHKMLE